MNTFMFVSIKLLLLIGDPKFLAYFYRVFFFFLLNNNSEVTTFTKNIHNVN